MNKKDYRKSGGVSIRVIHFAMLLCAAAVAALLVYSLYKSSNVFSTLNTETGNYIVRQKAAHDLMEASDYLTENVQHFTLMGDPVYMDNYYEEAYVSKRREAAIVSMTVNNADPALVQQLQEALEESQALMYREYYAMRLVVDAKGIQDYPDNVKAIELTEEDAFLSPEEKLELAQSMVMGEEYYASKELIRTKLKTNLETLEEQMAATRQETSAGMMQNLNRLRWLTGVAVALLAVLLGMTAYFSTLPLTRAVRAARRGDPVPETGSREFREMAARYNEIREKLEPLTEAEPQAGGAEKTGEKETAENPGEEG